MKNKKPIIALGALAVVGLIAGTIAYFTSEVEFDNVFTTAVYKTKSTEEFTSPDNWTPGTFTSKTVSTKNEGTVDVAVRVKTSEVWYKEAWSSLTDEQKAALTPEQLAEYVITVGTGEGQVPADAVIINTTAEDVQEGQSWDWIDNTSTDGYYYYKKKLAPQNTTATSFIKGVTLNSNLDVESECDEGVVTVDQETGKKTTTKTCSTSVAGLGKATYVLTITVETVQYDQYKAVWGNNAPTITES